MSETHRAYDIERDGDGFPVRMVWRGDYRRVVYVTCPKCPVSPRLIDGKCWTCWGDWRRVDEWERV